MAETDLVKRVKAYRIEHRCSLQEAIDDVRGPRPERVFTDATTRQGHIEQIIASLFVLMPDMSGDQRRRLRDDQYRSVQDVAREIEGLFALPTKDGEA